MNAQQQDTSTGNSSTGNSPNRPAISSRTWQVLLVLFLLFNILFYVPFLGSFSGSPQVTLSYSCLLYTSDAADE